VSLASGAFYLLFILLPSGYVQPYETPFDTAKECYMMGQYHVQTEQALAFHCPFVREI
jgi:hypothetical protein